METKKSLDRQSVCRVVLGLKDASEARRKEGSRPRRVNLRTTFVVGELLNMDAVSTRYIYII